MPGDYNYIEYTAEARKYVTIGNVVLAGHARARDLRCPLSLLAANIPFFKRYFMGGSSSLRGWGRFEISPLTFSGTPIGGHSMFESAAEVRIPAFAKFAIVGFVDAGNVWYDSFDFHLDDLKVDIRPGLRYLTPIGPVRVDLGFQLTRIEGLLVNGELEPRGWRIHFSIGQAF